MQHLCPNIYSLNATFLTATHCRSIETYSSIDPNDNSLTSLNCTNINYLVLRLYKRAQTRGISCGNRGGNQDRNKGGNQDRNRGGSKDRNRGGNKDRNKGGSEDRNKGGSEDRNKGGNEDRIRGP